MTHPDLFLSPAPTIESPIYWQKTAVELKELITAFDVDNAFGDVSSERIPVSEVVSCFEMSSSLAFPRHSPEDGAGGSKFFRGFKMSIAP